MVILLALFSSLLFLGMFILNAARFLIQVVRIGLNFIGIVVGIQSGLDYFEVLHELKRNSIGREFEIAISAVANGQQDSEDRLDTMPNDLQFTGIDRHRDAHISRPNGIAVFAVWGF